MADRYPFTRPQASHQPHPAMILNHTIAIDGNKKTRESSTTCAMEAVTSLAPSRLYTLRFRRWDAFTKRQVNLAVPGFTRFSATTRGRMVIGMGDESIQENSITLTWVDGVPVIPGSAIKGLAGAVARSGWFTVDGARHLRPEEIEVVTGTVDGASFFVFHDAWYVPDERAKPLLADVMTPHHQSYNAGRGAKPPDGFDDPIPIPFLSTRGTFLFSIEGPDAHWTQLARDMVVFGLQYFGIGAKTSSGYGRFDPPQETPPNPHAMHPQVVEIRSLRAASFRQDAESIAYVIVDLEDGVREVAARAFAQKVHDLDQTGWMTTQEWWELVEEAIGPFLGDAVPGPP